jgi:hypothetical protein
MLFLFLLITSCTNYIAFNGFPFDQSEVIALVDEENIVELEEKLRDKNINQKITVQDKLFESNVQIVETISSYAMRNKKILALQALKRLGADLNGNAVVNFDIPEEYIPEANDPLVKLYFYKNEFSFINLSFLTAPSIELYDELEPYVNIDLECLYYIFCGIFNKTGNYTTVTKSGTFYDTISELIRKISIKINSSNTKNLDSTEETLAISLFMGFVDHVITVNGVETKLNEEYDDNIINYVTSIKSLDLYKKYPFNLVTLGETTEYSIVSMCCKHNRMSLLQAILDRAEQENKLGVIAAEDNISIQELTKNNLKDALIQKFPIEP